MTHSNHGIALITGGTRGIGAAIAKEFKNAGYTVAVTYSGNDEAAAKFQEKTSIPAYKWDVGDYQACEKGVQKVINEVGHPDVLVNNAGITKDRMIHKMSVDEWQDVMSVNLNSVFNMTRQVISAMRDKKYGRVINISSINAQKGQVGQTNYCASKSGMIGFTKALAQEVARYNITVNAIAPGYVKTSMVEAVPEKIMESIIAQIPAGRLGEPEEIARIALMLASPDSAFITGSTITANGGQYMAG